MRKLDIYMADFDLKSPIGEFKCNSILELLEYIIQKRKNQLS